MNKIILRPSAKIRLALIFRFFLLAIIGYLTVFRVRIKHTTNSRSKRKRTFFHMTFQTEILILMFRAKTFQLSLSNQYRRKPFVFSSFTIILKKEPSLRIHFRLTGFSFTLVFIQQKICGPFRKQDILKHLRSRRTSLIAPESNCIKKSLRHNGALMRRIQR